MADEEQQDRTEEATPKKLEDARKKGDIPRSRELTMTGVMLTAATTLLFMVEPMLQDIRGGLSGALQISREHIFDTSYMPGAFAALAGSAFAGLIPLGLILLAAVFLGATSIGGWSFSMKAAAFKGDRLNPIKGLKRVFSANSLNELVKAMAKFFLVAIIALSWLWWSVDELLSLGREDAAVAVPHAMEIAGLSLLIVSCALILIALADVPFQLWNFRKKMKMTRQEVRDEFKEVEGRPEVKSKIRALQQQIATRRMMEDLPTADVVITNPTHFAVALRYDENSMGAPTVIAKGKDLMAKRIREVAAEHNVPLFSAPPLARSLFRSSKLGQEISPGLYAAVAQVLAYLMQLNAAMKTGTRWPEVPVPDIDESQY
jgi:flagellar biosynthetic protein FlhB